MSSFLQKLKGRGVGVTEEHTVTQANLPEKSDIPAGVTQLAVDVKQGDTEIVIFAQVPGTEIIKELDVSIEGDNDVITIQGTSRRPADLTGEQKESAPVSALGQDEHDGFTLEECAWGKFFRQIILPQEVDATNAKAKVIDGVLVLRLPLKGHSSNKMRMHVEKIDSD